MHENDDILDRYLLKRLQSGDNSAFAEIFNKYKNYLVVVAQYDLRDSVAAADLVQDLFERLWDNSTLHNLQLRDDVKLRTYLKQSIRNNCNKVNQSGIKRQKREEYFYISQEQRQEQREEMISEELDRKIRQYLHELPNMPRTVFTKVYLEQLPREKILEDLSISAKTLRNHLSKGVRLLQQRLNNSL